MSNITRKTDVAGEVVAKLIDQFKNSDKIVEVLNIFGAQLQDAEDAAIDTFEAFNLNTAVGDQLDTLGALVDEIRGGRADEDYRLAIKTKILLIQSQGRFSDMYGIVEGVIGQDLTMRLTESFPAAFFLEVFTPLDPATTDFDRLAAFTFQARAAGVRGLVAIAVTNPFQYDTGLGYDQGAYGQAYG